MVDLSIQASRCFQKGNMYFEDEDYDKAIVLFTLSLGRKYDEDVFHNIAISYYMKGHYHKAIKNYAISLAIKPDYNRSYNGWAFCLTNLGKYDEAILKWKKAVRIDPKYTQGYLNWGLALYWKREEVEAEKVIEKALKSSNLIKKTIVERYEFELALAKKRFDKAKNEYEKELLKDQIPGYRWMVELVMKKMKDDLDF